MTEPGLVTILKVRVENLQSPGPGGWGSRRLKVKFRAETAAVETLPKQPNHDGSIEWTEPLEMNVHDTEARLKAIVVSRSGDSGPWSLVPDGLFEGFPVKECPPVWMQVSGTGLKFRAELTTFINEGAEGALPLSRRPSQGESSSSHGSRQPPLPSPVGTPSVSRLMDDNFRLEEDGVSAGLPPPAVPSERVWGGPALRRESCRLDSTGSAQRGAPSIEFSPAFDAGDSPAPPPSQPLPRKKTKTLLLSHFSKKKAKTPPGKPGTGNRITNLSSHRSGRLSAARDTVKSSTKALPHGLSVSAWDPELAFAFGEPPGAPEVIMGERKTPTPPPDTDATVLSLERSSGRSGRMAGPQRGNRFRRRSAARREAAARGLEEQRAIEEPAVASPQSPGAMAAAMAAAVPAPTPPSAAPLVEGGEHGYDIPLPPDGATIPSPPSTVGQQGAGVQPDTARAKTPPPSYDDVFGSYDRIFERGPFAQHPQLAQQQVAQQQVAQQIYDAPDALGPRIERDSGLETVDFWQIRAGGSAPSGTARGSDTSEGRTFYPEGSMPQVEELQGARGNMFARGPVAPLASHHTPAVRPPPLASHPQLLDRVQSFEGEDEETAFKDEANRTMGEAPTYDHAVALGSRGEDGDTLEHEEGYSAMPADGEELLAAMHRLEIQPPRVTSVPRSVSVRTVEPESPTDGHPVALGPRVGDRDTLEHVEGYSAMPANSAALINIDGPNGSSPRAIYRHEGDSVMPANREELLAAMRRLEPRVTSVPRSVSVRTVEPAPTRAIQPVGRLEDREIRDPVCFSCLSPRSVWAEHTFQLHVLAYLPQLRDEVLQSAQSRGEVEAGLPGGMSILRGKEVTVKLDLPANIFKTLRPEGSGSSHPPSVRDFKWNGNVEAAGFTVECLQHAPVGVAPCGAHIIEGSQVTRLSFFIEVVEAGDARACDDVKAEFLDTKIEQVEANVAMIDPGELEVSEVIIGYGVQGKTFKGRWRGKDVAIKRLEQSSAPSSSVSGLRHEATILSLLGHHPNIVEFYGLSSRGGGNRDEGLDVVTKFEEGGSLQAALGIEGIGDTRTNGGRWTAGSGGKFSGYHRTAWARDMARGLANSHSVGVVHNDVACRNALLSSTEIGAPVLLCDFGMSRMLRGDGVERASLIDVQGTQDKWPVRQMPKESLIFPYSLSPSSDTWMYGTMLYEIFEGKKPFCGISSKEVKALIIEGKTLDTPVLLKEQGLEDVYRSCLEVDWTKRPKMEQVVEVLPH